MPRTPDQPGTLRQLGAVTGRVRNLERRSGGADGIQFNSGTYGPSNVGDYLYVETNGVGGNGINLNASGAGNSGIFLETHGASNAGFDLVTHDTGNGGFGLTTNGSGNGGIALTANDAAAVINTTNGTTIRSDPTAGAFPLTVQQFATGTDDGAGIELSVTSTSGESTGIRMAISSVNGSAVTIDAGATATGTGDATGITTSGRSTNGSIAHGIDALAQGSNSVAATAGKFTATQFGSGDAVGVYANVNPNGGNTNVYPLQCFVAGTKVFQINRDGSLHGLTGQTLAFDL